jgi:hypothetical protein
MKKTINGMSTSDAIELYYEKHEALHRGDIKKLIALKNQCPELFIEENDKQIRELIEYAKKFQSSEHYKELCRLELKEKLTLISNDTINKKI